MRKKILCFLRGWSNWSMYLFTSLWLCCSLWRTMTFVQAFLKLKLVSNNSIITRSFIFLMVNVSASTIFTCKCFRFHFIWSRYQQNRCRRWVCQLECIGNNGYKSFNVHRNGNNAKMLCELNNITRQIKPGDFKRKKGSTCYGSIQVGLKYVSGVQVYSFLFERSIRRRWRNKKYFR